MANRKQDPYKMPEVPDLDFVGALAEMWFVVSYTAYHLAYIRAYLQTQALQTDPDEIRKQEQGFRDAAQTDTVICRAHLAAFFWQIDHFFEALHSAITRGQKEQPNEQYFWAYEKRLANIEENPIYKEINAYRNIGHRIPAIIGCSWEKKGGAFRHHFLPSIEGLPRKEDVDINTVLQRYFEFVANVWLAFAPSELKGKFPRDFQFPLTIPFTFQGELPAELHGIPQWTALVQAQDMPVEPKASDSQVAESPENPVNDGS